VHAVRREQRLPARVRPGDRTGVCVDQSLSTHGGADGQGAHRDVPGRRFRQAGGQPGRVPHGLQHQPDDLGLRPGQGVLQVVRRRGDQLLPGGDHHRVAERAMRPEHGGEHRPGVGDQGDRARRQRITLEVADRPDAAGGVDEPHASTADHRHLTGGRHHILLEAVDRAEHHGTGVPALGGDPQRGSERLVGDAQQHEVDRLGHLRQRRHARPAEDRCPRRMHQVHPLDAGAAEGLGRQATPEGVDPVAGTDDRHGAGRHHRPNPGRGAGQCVTVRHRS
jgi:hypothetical protein